MHDSLSTEEVIFGPIKLILYRYREELIKMRYGINRRFVATRTNM
jgi:hypothetical protein